MIDDYSEDWTRLAYVLIHGTARVLDPHGAAVSEHLLAVAAPRVKYPQYATMHLETRPVIRIAVTDLRDWSARNGFDS